MSSFACGRRVYDTMSVKREEEEKKRKKKNIGHAVISAFK